jgi:hypothetical protein
MPEVYGQVTLSWTRNGESDLAGYRVYYGTSPIAVNHSVDVWDSPPRRLVPL